MTVIRCNMTVGNAFLRNDGPIASLTLHADTRGVALDEPLGTAVGNAFAALIGGIDQVYSDGCAATALMKLYDLSDPSAPGNPREAFFTGEVAFTPGADTLPGEVAMNVSYRAARLPGVPAQRHRGAVQLGPLALNVLDATTGRIAGGPMGVVATAFEGWAEDLDAADCDWVVGSEAQGYEKITESYIVNEFGTVGTRQMTASGTTAITLP